MNISAANRMFSSIRNSDKNHVVYQYAWSDNAIITGGQNGPITGAFIPVAVDPSGFVMANPQVSTVTYSPVITGGTTFQITIPANAYNWSVNVQSGVAFVNGFPLYSPTVFSTPGVGFGGKGSAPITVGITGGAAILNYLI